MKKPRTDRIKWTPEHIKIARDMWYNYALPEDIAKACGRSERAVYAYILRNRKVFPKRVVVNGKKHVPPFEDIQKEHKEHLKPVSAKNPHQKEVNRKLRLALMHEHKAKRSHAYGRMVEALSHKNAANIARKQALALEGGV